MPATIWGKPQSTFHWSRKRGWKPQNLHTKCNWGDQGFSVVIHNFVIIEDYCLTKSILMKSKIYNIHTFKQLFWGNSSLPPWPAYSARCWVEATQHHKSLKCSSQTMKFMLKIIIRMIRMTILERPKLVDRIVVFRF